MKPIQWERESSVHPVCKNDSENVHEMNEIEETHIVWHTVGWSGYWGKHSHHVLNGQIVDWQISGNWGKGWAKFWVVEDFIIFLKEVRVHKSRMGKSWGEID